MSSGTEGQGSLLPCTLWSDFILTVYPCKQDQAKASKIDPASGSVHIALKNVTQRVVS